MLAVAVLTLYFSFVHQALLFRNRRVTAAFTYSFRLVWRGGWPFVAIFALIILITMSLTGMVSWLLMALLPISWGEAMNRGYPLFTFLGTYLTICFTVLFLNMDRRS